VGLVFIGAGLGIMRAETLIRKIREIESTATRLIGVGVPAESDLRAQLDGTMARAFVTETLLAELAPFIRLQGPLQTFEDLAPQFGACLTSAVTQVFGMMGALEATHVKDGPADAGPSLVGA
jgi:hypothetical protein